MAKQKTLNDEWTDKIPKKVEEAAEEYDKLHTQAQKLKGKLNTAKQNIIDAMVETGCKRCPVRNGEKFIQFEEKDSVKFEKPKQHPTSENGEADGQHVTMKRVRGGRMVTQRSPGSVSAVPNDAGAAQPVGVLADYGLTPKKCDALAVAFGKTIGHLEKAIRTNDYWHKDVKGFGEEWITKLIDSLVAFRRAFPVPSEDDLPTVLDEKK
jgi:hypothetical protein